jgi:hypothetical protein
MQDSHTSETFIVVDLESVLNLIEWIYDLEMYHLCHAP